MDTQFAAQATTPSCSKHNDELHAFCHTCGERICEECVKNEHIRHDWSLKAKFVRKAKENGTLNHDLVQEKVLSTLKAKLNIRKADQSKINEVREDLKRIVDEYANSLLEQMDLLDGNTTELETEIENMEAFADFFKNGIHEAHDNVIMEMQESLHTQLNKYDSPRPVVLGKFKQGKINAEEIHSMFGRLKEKKKFAIHQASMVTIKTVSNFSQEDDEVNSIMALAPDIAYILYGNKSYISLINHEGILQDNLHMAAEVSDILIFDDNIIFSSPDDKVIHRISSTTPDSQETVWSTAPLYPRGLCMSADKTVLVCLGDRPANDMKDTTKGKVGELSMSGELQVFNKEEGRALFVSPYRIAQNSNNDICVVDILDQNQRSRLVVITSAGQLRFTYTGQSSLRERFVPHGVCCDRHGRIILPDYYNDAVHMLNSDGLFIQFLLTQSHPLLRPLTATLPRLRTSMTETLPRLRTALKFLPVDNNVRRPRSVDVYDETIWVGCDEGVIKIFTIDNK